MNNATTRIRLVQWTTGKVATQAIKAILERPNLEIVGLYAYSVDKVGQDIGDLIGLGRKVGVKATNDIAALLALKPDCVVYMPLHPDVDHMVRILKSGVNIVTTASFLTGRGYGEEARRRLEAAAQEGAVSLFGSGINPGWIDSVVATASSACREVNLVRVTESFNIGMWAGDANQNEIGWGRPAGDPNHPAALVKATLPFGDAVEAVAHMFDFKLDEIRCETEFAHATQDLDIPGRPVKKGQVAGTLARWLGIANGVPVIELNAQWALSDDITPAWDIAMAYQVEIKGTPNLKFRAEVLPEDMSLPMEELVATGFIITALPVVNAIPAVVGARPGIVTYADLKPVTSVLRPGQQRSLSPLPLREPDELPASSDSTSQGASGHGAVAGRWDMTIKTPGSAQKTVLVLENRNGVWSGSQSDGSTSSELTDIVVDGTSVRWMNTVTKPIKLKCDFKATVNGKQMSGKLKAGLMGSYAFTAVKL